MNMMQSEVSEPQSSEIPPSSQGSWLALLTVAITAFALVTSEFLPIGVLNDISSDLHVSVGTAGLMITLPGIMAAIAAPLLPVHPIICLWDGRKTLLLGNPELPGPGQSWLYGTDGNCYE